MKRFLAGLICGVGLVFSVAHAQDSGWMIAVMEDLENLSHGLANLSRNYNQAAGEVNELLEFRNKQKALNDSIAQAVQDIKEQQENQRLVIQGLIEDRDAIKAQITPKRPVAQRRH